MMPGPSPGPLGPAPLDRLPTGPAVVADAAAAAEDVAPVGEVAAPEPPIDQIPATPAGQPVEQVAATPADQPVDQLKASVGPGRAVPEPAGPPPPPPPAAPPSALRAGPPMTPELGLPSSSAEVREFVRQTAIQNGIDPDVAVRVVLSEGGLTPATWIGDHGSSFGPLQLHYGGIASGGNAVGGLGDAFTAQTHLDARDPRTWRQQVQWALGRAARDGWGAWHGAAAANIGPREGIGVAMAPGSAPTYATALIPASARPHVSVPNQFAANLSPQEAYAACGPVAAVAIARFLGRTPTVAEALQLAKQNGWTLEGGMNGIANEKRLLEAMHINVQMEVPPNLRHVQLTASRGTPVILSTPNHYWVIDDYDPITGEYHVGQSGLVYRGGAEWMTAERIQQLGGGLSGALYIDSPLAQPAGAQWMTVNLDAGWSVAAARPPLQLDAGWSRPAGLQSHAATGPLDPGWSVPGAPVAAPPAAGPAAVPVAAAAPEAAPPPPTSAPSPPGQDRWWEDVHLVRQPAAPKSGPEWV